MNERSLTEAFYRFVARLDDDPLVDSRVREHAHLIRQEMLERHPNLDVTLPNDGGAAEE